MTKEELVSHIEYEMSIGADLTERRRVWLHSLP